MKKKILFVCLGNICRSPAAEAVFKNLVIQNQLLDHFEIDSAGTNGFHDGENADHRSIEAAKKKNIVVDSISRKIKNADLNYFDHIIVMDDSNLKTVQNLCTNDSQKLKIKKLTDFKQKFTNNFVPDPYYGTMEDFHYMMNLIEDCCEGLLKVLA